MLQMTIIASLIATLIFSTFVLKIMGDVETVLPTASKSASACEVGDLKSVNFKNFDSIEN